MMIMGTQDDVRRIALALPEVTESETGFSWAGEPVHRGHTTGHQRNHPPVDGRCGFRRELLACDGAYERREVVRPLSGSKATRAMPPNQRR